MLLAHAPVLAAPAALLSLTNGDRAALGAPPLIDSPLLDLAAQAMASDMALRGYFAHVSPEGKRPWDWLLERGYRYAYAGENLAVNFPDLPSAEAAWMNSPPHRANILNTHYTQMGSGTAHGLYKGYASTYVVIFFAAPP